MYVPSCLPYVLCPLTGGVGDRCPRGVGSVRSYLGLVPPPTAASGRTNDRHQGGHQYRIQQVFTTAHISCSFASSDRLYAALNPGTVDTDMPRGGVEAITPLTTCKAPTFDPPSVYPCMTLVQGLRHPSVEAARGSSMFIPNDVDLRDDSRLAIVTGAPQNANRY